jgi:aspartyl-tRNA(Asn)/glutamyl-tRNA(Gln) amidotransferase subunit A
LHEKGSGVTNDLHFMTVAEMAAAIEKKALSPVELTEALLQRIEAINPQLDAFVTLTAEQARAAARHAETEIAKGRYRGPVHGVPFGLKDIYDTAGIHTTGHSKTCVDRVPAEDATTTARLKAAGGILMGKLATHEFAHGGPSFDLPWPPARNPWKTDCFTGGSSSGSGAAVAAGLVPAALGSDTGGSIRTPSGLCGLAGLKPTYGLVSRAGVIPNSFTFDTCGPMTWTVEDCAILLQALAGFDARDPASADRPVPDYRAALSGDIRGLRIGAVRHFWEEDLPAKDETRQSMEAAIEIFRGLGAVVEDVRLEPMQVYTDVKVVIAESELFSIHSAELRKRPGDFGFDFRGRVLPGCLLTAEDYVQAQKLRRRLVEAMDPVYAKYDVLIAPSTYGPAPLLSDHSTVSFWQKPKITTVFNVTAGPALALCAGFSAGGLPLPMQIVGRPFDDATVLKAGHAYEQATPWRGRRPQLLAGAKPLPAKAPPMTTDLSHVDAKARRIAEVAAERAGLTLPEPIYAQLLEGTPHVLEVLQRLRGEFGFADEPGNTWSFPATFRPRPGHAAKQAAE